MQPQESTTKKGGIPRYTTLRYEDNKYRDPKVCREEFLSHLKQ